MLRAMASFGSRHSPGRRERNLSRCPPFSFIPGPRFSGKLDVHTMALGMMLALLGVHIISIGLFVKAFSFTEKLARNQLSFARLLKRVKLEHGLVLGGSLTIFALP